MICAAFGGMMELLSLYYSIAVKERKKDGRWVLYSPMSLEILW